MKMKMGIIYAELELVNADDLALARKGYIKDHEVKKTKVNALVDSGAFMLAINEDIQTQLQLPKLEERLAELADGSRVLFPVVGPILIKFENRKVLGSAMVLPRDSEVLLGSIPMEEMDVVILPKEQKLAVNPATPYIPKLKMK